MPDKENLAEIYKTLEEMTNKLTIPFSKEMQKEISVLKELIMNQRQPRLMIIGRRGAGKSSLLNAIFGEKIASIGSVKSETARAEWYTWKSSRGALDLLDTRGLGDRTNHDSAKFQNAIRDINEAVKKNAPDAVLFLCKAKEVDARITDDLKNANEILRFIKAKHKNSPPVIGIITQVDELDPLSEVNPPYERKLKNINLATNTLNAAFKAEGIDSLNIFPTSSYAEYDENGKPTFTKIWNIDQLVEYLVDILPREAKIQFARMSVIRTAQEKTCRLLVHSSAMLCSGIAGVPIPIADIFPITSLQIGLITSIGYISGRTLTFDNAREFLAPAGLNIGGAFVFREAARALVKFIFPGYGSVISASVAYAGTLAVGEAAIAYYIKGKDIRQAQQVLKEVFSKKQNAINENFGK